MSWDTFVLPAGRFLEAVGLRLMFGLVAAVVAWRLASWARSSFDRIATGQGVDPSAQLLGARLVYGVLLVLGAIWVLQIVGIEVTPVLATFGVAGLALSLAVQDILKSFFAGLYLLYERPFLIGDEIQIKEHIGRVENIGFRSTSVRTADNVLVIVPNSMLFVEAVSNRSQRRAPESDVEEQEPEDQGSGVRRP